MKLTIITINRNNAAGLKKTMESVFTQTSKNFEYIVIDGASADESQKVMSDKGLVINGKSVVKDIPINCISEPDTGIYNAMNKGIKMAKGEYVQFLNSGDCLVDEKVVENMLFQLSTFNFPTIMYGNMLKTNFSAVQNSPFRGLGGRKNILRDKGFAGRQPTMLDFYSGTLNHSSAYIRRNLFDKYGLYDESLKIVSDWKWYLQAIIIGGEQIQYVDVDVSLFDMTGISTVNSELDKAERKQVLESLFSEKILKDYEKYAFPINQWERIQRYWLTGKCFWLIERLLFKWEKLKNKSFVF